MGEIPVFITWNWMSMILTIAIVVLAFGTIFVHKGNTKSVKPTLFLQLRLSVANIILQLGLIVLVWMQLRGRAGELSADWNANLSFIFSPDRSNFHLVSLTWHRQGHHGFKILRPDQVTSFRSPESITQVLKINRRRNGKNFFPGF